MMAMGFTTQEQFDESLRRMKAPEGEMPTIRDMEDAELLDYHTTWIVRAAFSKHPFSRDLAIGMIKAIEDQAIKRNLDLTRGAVIAEERTK